MNAKNDKLVEIYRANGEAAAEVVRAKLECNGIPAVLQSSASPSVHAFTLDGLGEYRVMVLESMAEEARIILKGEEDV